MRRGFFRLDGVVTLVDAKHADETIAKEEVALDQIAFADRIFISKTDLVSSEELAALKERLIAINPAPPSKWPTWAMCPSIR